METTNSYQWHTHCIQVVSNHCPHVLYIRNSCRRNSSLRSLKKYSKKLAAEKPFILLLHPCLLYRIISFWFKNYHLMWEILENPHEFLSLKMCNGRPMTAKRLCYRHHFTVFSSYSFEYNIFAIWNCACLFDDGLI